MAFYNVQSDEVLSIEEVTKSEVLCKICVATGGISKHHWKLLGHVPLEDELLVPINFYKRDCISKELSIYTENVQECPTTWQERPATYEECVGLELAAVWSIPHVESRLEDHFAGRENKWVKARLLPAK